MLRLSQSSAYGAETYQNKNRGIVSMCSVHSGPFVWDQVNQIELWRKIMAIEHTFAGKNGPETMVLTPMKAIRKKCLECSAWQPKEVKACPIKDCALYPYRFGLRKIKTQT